MRRAKIVCTIGPKSRDRLTLRRMIAAGMDVARLNMSHGTHSEHAEVVERIREISAELDKEVGILADLSGPKIRLGDIPEPIEVAEGDVAAFAPGDTLADGVIPVRYQAFVKELCPGDLFSLSDGQLAMRVVDVTGGVVRAVALNNGRISSRKGVNIPQGGDHLPALTPKDVEDLRWAIRQGVDWASLSFVRTPEDAKTARDIMDEEGKRLPLIAKIEKPKAIERIDEIVAAFDGIMVARGDLGVEMALEELPAIQKMIIRKARLAGKPVITATQMLLSMVTSERPTRAEVTDVANAILDGSDAVMLSEETAMGDHPPLVVTTMARIADKAVAGVDFVAAPQKSQDCYTMSEAIARSACDIAREVGAKAIVTPTSSGHTAMLVSKMRPSVPILAFCVSRSVARMLALSWGVVPLLVSCAETTDELINASRDVIFREIAASGGDRIVITAGVPLFKSGTTNLVKVIEL